MVRQPAHPFSVSTVTVGLDADLAASAAVVVDAPTAERDLDAYYKILHHDRSRAEFISCLQQTRRNHSEPSSKPRSAEGRVADLGFG
jgi:hypothetical protein